MKKRVLLGLMLSVVPSFLLPVLSQEQVRIWKQGDSKRFTTSEILFAEDGASFTVEGETYVCSEIDSMAVVHTVSVTFNGDEASVDLGHARDTKNELEFVVKGESTHGSLTYDGPLKCKFYLDGLNLTSDRGAAIDIQCGKRIDMILVDGTENVLTDAAGGTQKAALYCKGHLELSGGGSLTVTGNTKHAIATKEYLMLKKSTGKVTVAHAVSDAMHVGQYFQMNGGTVSISGQGGEGIQVEVLTLDDDVTPNPEKENNGQTFIRGGSLNITASAACSKGIKCAKDLTVSGGTFEIAASGDGTKGISVSGNMVVGEEDNATTITVRATGSVYEDEVTEDDTYCMGIKVKGNLTVNAGTIRVSNKGSGTKGIKVSGTYTKNGGTVQASITKGN